MQKFLFIYETTVLILLFHYWNVKRKIIMYHGSVNMNAMIGKCANILSKWI